MNAISLNSEDYHDIITDFWDCHWIMLMPMIFGFNSLFTPHRSRPSIASVAERFSDRINSPNLDSIGPKVMRFICLLKGKVYARANQKI